jgi:hypothetical protein
MGATFWQANVNYLSEGDNFSHVGSGTAVFISTIE